jgi:hypothetical protein
MDDYREFIGLVFWMVLYGFFVATVLVTVGRHISVIPI